METNAAASILALLFMPVTSDNQPASNWIVNIRSDPMSDEQEGSASLQAQDGSLMIFACNGLNEKTLSVQYVPKGYLGSTDNSVTIRFDTDKPFPSVVWTYAKRGAYIINPAYVDAFSLAVNSGQQTIRVRALNYETQPVDAIFTSNNGRQAINQIRRICTASAI